jgi:hypothetical protein
MSSRQEAFLFIRATESEFPIQPRPNAVVPSMERIEAAPDTIDEERGEISLLGNSD